MLWQIIGVLGLLLVTISPGWAAIWPEEFFGHKRISVTAHSPGHEPVWEEYGFEEGEIAQYVRNGKKFKATAYRFNDATSAMAVYEWKKPANCRPVNLVPLACRFDHGVFLAYGNYVMRFDGFVPTEEQIVGQLLIVPMLEQSALPSWVGFVPSDGQVPGTERFAIGPASLAEFEPRVPPSMAGFHFGVEVQFAEYESPKGNLKLGVFSYPTPQIARERLREFQKLPDSMVKRSGPLLAVVFDPPDADEAEDLLGRVNYRATIIWDKSGLAPEPTLLEIFLSVALFSGALFLAAVLLGALFGGWKLRHWRSQGLGDDSIVLLHIEDK